jgi:neurotransmitter:Na+ symporter, NSS family
MAEVNKGKGMKVKNWMKPVFSYVLPIGIIVIYIIGMVTFDWR